MGPHSVEEEVGRGRVKRLPQATQLVGGGARLASLAPESEVLTRLNPKEQREAGGEDGAHRWVCMRVGVWGVRAKSHMAGVVAPARG